MSTLKSLCVYCGSSPGRDAAYADTFVTNFVAFRNILLNGTEEQARHFVEKTENNGFAAFCLTEANAGSDVAAMRTTACSSIR